MSTTAPTLPQRAAEARSAERSLLSLGVTIVLAAYILLGLSTDATIPLATLVFGGALAILAALGHLTIRRFVPNADPVLFPIAFLLNGLGLVLVRRVDLAEGSALAVAQTTWTVVGIGAFAVTLLFLRDHRRLARYSYTLGLVTILLLLLPRLPFIGAEVNGARLWIRVLGMSFQPGEVAKITLVVFLAGYLERKRALLSVATQRLGPLLLPPPRHLGPVLLAGLAAVGVLVLQRDLGSALLFLGIFVVMLYVATGRIAYPLVGLVSFSVGAVLAYQLFAHVRVRFAVWLDPWSDINDTGYQIAQATFALGTGGMTGTGLGLGRPDRIPFAATDFVFAVLGEELGLLGATAVLVGFVLLIARGYKTALAAVDEVGSLLAAGLTSILALQVFIIVGGVTRLVPLTGITLPFMSYGGSSLVANYVLLALLLVVSNDARRAGRPPR